LKISFPHLACFGIIWPVLAHYRIILLLLTSFGSFWRFLLLPHPKPSACLLSYALSLMPFTLRVKPLIFNPQKIILKKTHFSNCGTNLFSYFHAGNT
jgi:hypothetical protein